VKEARASTAVLVLEAVVVVVEMEMVVAAVG
jgi:hypothetical protein